ncbi:peptidoglycan DD-metalloendopeptidase family protein [Sediminibacterium soli]|uniref:peptidoglycan DD-metalloendopeptidase family protein n=1 Tax=Sediminibacterium soli TaxID=2698829 RepID=UPI00137A673D|nr:peptidoglycan DD-metalloendopeptidase family protein [Sediminibacterium soli]NCI45507.1 peptidoglycan DD-metalloendopeptidase family protein [Sediminibacterium soli]
MKKPYWLERLPSLSAAVVDFDRNRDTLLAMDFTDANQDLTDSVVTDTDAFSEYITNQLQAANARYGIGGYDELRTVYSRSSVFDGGASAGEPRRLHLGIDIWGAAGSPVYAPLAGTIHSFAFNDHYGDYGATIILAHRVDEQVFHSLYGHLSLSDLDELYEGKQVEQGSRIAGFGQPSENGHWPPHLHFQLIIDMEGKKGDYPGVCKLSERDLYLANCPNPDGILQLMQYA